MSEVKLPLLLSIIEIGGYPDFRELYASLGYEVAIETKMRQVLKRLKKETAAVVIAEFNYQTDFRDRTSNLESLMSVLQRSPDTRVVIFYDKEHKEQLKKLQVRFRVDARIAFPVEEEVLDKVLKQLQE